MKIQGSYGDRVFDVINIVIITLLTLLFLYPLVYVLSCSISDPIVVAKGGVTLLPVNIEFTAYDKVFNDKGIMLGYWNTIKYTAVGIAVGVALTVMAAYPLSRKDLVGRQVFTFILTFTMFFSGGLIPFYMVCRTLKLINSFWAIILPSAVSMWNIFVMRTYFTTSIPEELIESAYIDGARNIRILLSIVLPLSGPIIAVMVLFYGVGYWNSYYSALIFLSDTKMYPLQLVLRDILVKNSINNMLLAQSGIINGMVDIANKYVVTIRYACIVVASLPVIILYPFLQRYFVKGIMIGAIKG